MSERDVNCPLLTWSDAKEIVEKGDLHMLGRSASQHADYMIFNRDIKSKWKSVLDYILCKKFDCESGLDEDSGKLKAIRPRIVVEKTSFSINDFPYHFEPCVHHYIYWKLGSKPLNSEEVQSVAAEFMKERKEFTEFVIYINPPHLMSIPELDHAHILFLKTE